ncbi:MAG: hypothetical protein WKG01_26940 [Kofleriaceae bacterium]
MHTRTSLCSTLLIVAAMGCGSDSANPPDAPKQPDAGSEGTAQTPPTGAAAIEAWLSQGFYKGWNCEGAVHAGRSPTPHGFNRICTNSALSLALPGSAAWPAGAAAVKELHASAAGGTPIGYAVYLKQEAESAGGAGWYWYERINADVVADGTGAAGPAKTVCVGCHMGAGSDPAHTPTPGGRDLVYTPIPPQTPPLGGAAVEAWLGKGYYQSWHCETAVHAGRAPTPHGFNRICSNNAIAANATGSSPWPAGAAAVKELHSSLAGGVPIGYAVYAKQAADSAAGASWYWYERLPAPDGVVADGMGDSGPPKTICVACHTGAGSDPAHTPSPGARDQVYSPIP